MDRAGALSCDCAGPTEAGDWLRVGLGLVISGQLMVLSLARNLSDVDADTHARLSVALLGLTALGTALLAPELWRATRRAWARGDASLEAMFLLALAGGAGASLWGLWTGGDVFFEVVTVVLTVHALGARLKERFWSAALARLGAAAWLPDRALVVRDRAVEEVALDSLRAGDRVAVFGGDRLPADGVVAEGTGWLDTSSLDGNLAKLAVGVGDAVPGGALVERGPIRVDLVRAPDEGDHARAVAALLDAAARELPRTSLARRLARWFAPVVATVALASAAAWTWHAGLEAGFRVGTAVLLVACPCGLGVATPVALWAAAADLGARGVVVRRLGAIEDLARVRTVVLDKTGTLTSVRAEPVWGDAPARLRSWVAAVEGWSNHPVAAALRGPVPGPIAVKDVRELPGGGLAARVADGDASAEVVLRPLRETRGVEVQVDGRTAARVALVERPVDDASELVSGLALRGVEVEILTGDAIAPGLGVPCRTRTAPADKLARVRELRASGAVAFVGDAANDLPAMAGADVSVAVRGACAGVAERVDVSVPSAAALLPALDAARATGRRLRLLVGASALGNVVGMSIAAAGWLHPVLAGVLMAGSSLAVTLAAAPGADRAR